MIYRNIELEQQPGVVTIWLNRPEKRNAFDSAFLAEINEAVKTINKMI